MTDPIPVVDPAVVVDPAPVDAAPAKPTFRLNLDADGVYWGATQIHPEDAQPTDVVLDAMPDNREGVYRWNPVDKRLDPLPPSQQKEKQTAPDLERTFDALCAWLADNDSISLPPLVAEWRAWYAKSIDAKKTID